LIGRILRDTVNGAQQASVPHAVRDEMHGLRAASLREVDQEGSNRVLTPFDRRFVRGVPVKAPWEGQLKKAIGPRTDRSNPI
jgi:hypothetical protein